MAIWPEFRPPWSGGLLLPVIGRLRQHPFRRRLFGAMAALCLLVATLWLIPTPYYVTLPGDALAADQLVRAAGAPQAGHSGKLLLLTVSVRQANLFWWLYAHAVPGRARLQNRTEYLGPYPSYEEYHQDSVRMMEDSRRFAAAAGLGAMGYHVPVQTEGLYVSAVLAGSPARGVLRAGDLITMWAGNPAHNLKDAVASLATHSGGTPIQLQVRRGDREIDLQVPTAKHLQREGATIGVVLTARYQVSLPVDVQITPGIVSGPSAGLVFSLEVVAQLTYRDLLGGRTVAATGEVDWLGNVGPIGGAALKVLAAEAAGASVMFVPSDNYPEAAQVATRLQLVPVRTVTEALQWLSDHPAGGSQ